MHFGAYTCEANLESAETTNNVAASVSKRTRSTCEANLESAETTNNVAASVSKRTRRLALRSVHLRS